MRRAGLDYMAQERSVDVVAFRKGNAQRLMVSFDFLPLRQFWGNGNVGLKLAAIAFQGSSGGIFPAGHLIGQG